MELVELLSSGFIPALLPAITAHTFRTHPGFSSSSNFSFNFNFSLVLILILILILIWFHFNFDFNLTSF